MIILIVVLCDAKKLDAAKEHTDWKASNSDGSKQEAICGDDWIKTDTIWYVAIRVLISNDLSAFNFFLSNSSTSEFAYLD